MHPNLEVILFDVGNTLLFPNWERILAPLAKLGILPTHEQLQAIERRTKNEFDEMVTHGTVDHGYWQLFYSHLLNLLGVQENGVGRALNEATRQSSNWDRVRPGTREILQQIGSAYRIGVISNADGKIAEVLKVCGICDCFLSITDSGLIGHEKPHPAIFAAALEAMNVPPQRALYVGDVYAVDYLGARNTGMQAVLFDVAGAYRERGLPRVESLQQLQQLLKKDG
ncbi:MAG TPA: HAD family hydrolase [Terriglobales bacterium]|nr:HAD family hydrolase [Terriglobales bacterium]